MLHACGEKTFAKDDERKANRNQINRASLIQNINKK
jgi:hypothetical protein